MGVWSRGNSVPMIARGNARKACLLVAVACVVAFGSISQAFAQANLPASDHPGRIEKRFEQPRQPLSTLEPTIPESRPSPDEADHIRFSLVGVLVDGAMGTAKAADFFPLYSDRLGRDVSLSEVYRIADAITDKLKADGQSATRAIVPPQRVTGGIVRIAIIQGGGQ